MFAHQVIENLNKIKTQHRGIKDLVSDTIKAIFKSVKFHLGEQRTLNATMQCLERRQLFSDNVKYLKMPYNICWFDMFNNGEMLNEGMKEYPLTRVNKRAMLVFQYPRNLHVTIFNYYDEMKMWGMGLISYAITPTENYKQSAVPFLSRYGNPASRTQTYVGPGTTILPAIINLSRLNDDQIGNIIADDLSDLRSLNTAILLLNCKNITAETIKAPEALNMARQRKGKQELFDYKILKIKPGTARAEQDPRPHSDDHNRIHFCRGHFKEYTKEHPLFGKYTGLWWWQPHVRGQNDDGMVMKDYLVVT